MINNLLNDPNYTAEQKVQLMQLMTEFTDLHKKLEQNKANVGMLEIKNTLKNWVDYLKKLLIKSYIKIMTLVAQN